MAVSAFYVQQYGITAAFTEDRCAPILRRKLDYWRTVAMPLPKFKPYGVKRHLLRIRGLSSTARAEILAKFCIRNPAYEQALAFSPYGRVSEAIPKFLAYAWFHEEDNDLYVHRGLNPRDFSKPVREELLRLDWLDERTAAYTEWPEARLTLNDEQQRLKASLERAIARGIPFGSVLFLASTSVGKTIFQLAVARRFGHKTLVICPTEQILLAWYSDCFKFLGLREKSIGLIKAGRFDLKSPVTLASLRTLQQREERWPEINRYFGTVVIDEVQGVSANGLFRFVEQCPAKWLIGATATETVRDQPNWALKAIFGKPLDQIDVQGVATETSMPISSVTEVRTAFEFPYQAGNLRWDAFSEALMADDLRNELILENVLRDFRMERVCLVVSRRTQHLRILADMLTERGIRSFSFITGETNQDRNYTTALIKMINRRQTRLILASEAAVKTGANIRALDTLHITMPLASQDILSQLLGRIRRTARGKHEARVTYYLDVKVDYARKLYRRVAYPVFQRSKIPGYQTALYSTYEN